MGEDLTATGFFSPRKVLSPTFSSFRRERSKTLVTDAHNWRRQVTFRKSISDAGILTLARLRNARVDRSDRATLLPVEPRRAVKKHGDDKHNYVRDPKEGVDQYGPKPFAIGQAGIARTAPDSAQALAVCGHS